MISTKLKKYRKSTHSFNMTPMIDMTFLLILFFAVAGKFIEAENFAVNVPGGCEAANMPKTEQGQLTTVTIIKENSIAKFAVGAEFVSGDNKQELVKSIAALIDNSIKDKPPQQKIVVLRIDKDVDYADAQYALYAVAESSASDIRIAAMREKN